MAAEECELFPNNPSHCGTISWVKTAVASFSLVGSLFIIFVIWLFKKYKYFTQRLILSLSTSAMLDSIAFLMGSVHAEAGALCTFQAWLLSFADTAVLLWVCCITFNLYRNAVRKQRTEGLEKYYHIVSWGICLLIACLPLIGDHYGPAGPWCWIAEESSHSAAWRFSTYYVPLFIAIIVLFIIYIYIFVTIRRQAKGWEGTYNPEAERNKALMKEEIKPLLAYPFIYLVTSVFPTIHRIYNAASKEPHFTMMLLHVISSPLIGVLFAVVFGMDRETLSRLKWTNIKVALRQHTGSTKPLVREYAVGETTEVYANDDSSWGTGSSNEAARDPSPTTVQAPPPPRPTEDFQPVEPPTAADRE